MSYNIPMKEPLKSNESSLSQTLILDVSKVKSPIELEVNQVTDWGALTLTLVITVIVSTISAYVTIKLVTKSNNNLIKNQNVQNEYSLQQQRELQQLMIESQERQKRNELKNEYIRNWIDELKVPAENIIYKFETYIPALSAAANAKIESQKNLNLSDIYTEKSKAFILHLQNISTYHISLQLHLNSNKKEEVDILNDIQTIIQLCTKLHNEVFQKITQLDNQTTIQYNDLESADDAKSFYINIKLLKQKLRTLLNEEWDKLRSFHDI